MPLIMKNNMGHTMRSGLWLQQYEMKVYYSPLRIVWLPVYSGLPMRITWGRMCMWEQYGAKSASWFPHKNTVRQRVYYWFSTEVALGSLFIVVSQEEQYGTGSAVFVPHENNMWLTVYFSLLHNHENEGDLAVHSALSTRELWSWHSIWIPQESGVSWQYILAFP
jgi:hypothetical protein